MTGRMCRYLIVIAFIVGTLGQAVMPAMASPNREGDAPFSAKLHFTSAPIVDRATELVLTLSNVTSPAEVSTEIVLPDGIGLLNGQLKGQAKLVPGSEWQQAVVVKVLSAGDFQITASVVGTGENGVSVQKEAVLYVAATTKTASTAEIPIRIPRDPVITPGPVDGPDTQGKSSIEARQDSAQVTVNPQANWAMQGDDTPARSVRKAVGPELNGVTPEQEGAPTQFRLSDGQQVGQVTSLKPSNRGGLVPLADDSSTPPKFVPREAGDQTTDAGAPSQTQVPTDTLEIPQGLKDLPKDAIPGQKSDMGSQSLTKGNEKDLVGASLLPDPPAFVDRTGKGSNRTYLPLISKGTGSRNEAGNQNVGAAATSVPTGYGPDLIVEDIWSTTTPLRAEEWEDIYHRIKNRGTYDAGDTFYTTMWIDSWEVTSWSCDGLPAGWTAEGGVSVRLNKAGYKAVRIQVDSTDVIYETSESNNVRTESWTWDHTQADLVVWDIWSETNPLYVDEWENITFEIYNQGTQGTGNTFYTTLWFDGWEVDSWYVDGLDWGYSVYGSVEIKTYKPGSHTTKVQVDTTNAVSESNEGNNTRSETWKWGIGTDLLVTDIWCDTNPLEPGVWELLTFEIYNQGSVGTTQTFYSKMWVDSTQVGDWYCGGLDAGYSATASAWVRVSPPGNHTVKVQVDTSKVVAEYNESNNTRTETWNWPISGHVDLVVDDIWSDSAPLTGGTWEDVTFQITNLGTTPTLVKPHAAEPSARLQTVAPDQGKGQVEVHWDNELGTPSMIEGDIVTAAAPTADRDTISRSFFDKYKALYRMKDPKTELAASGKVKTDKLGMTHTWYNQMYKGVKVYGGELIVHTGKDGKMAAVNGAYVPDLDISADPTTTPEAAVNVAQAKVGVPQAVPDASPELVVYRYGSTAYLVWKMRLTSDEPLGAWMCFVDAHSGQVVDMYSDLQTERNRLTYTANNGWTLPGTLLLNESSTSSSDSVAWTAHVNIGTTYDYYRNVYGRDSYNSRGATIVSTVHLGNGYNNAYWNGQQLAFGDGNGYTFGPFGNALDVVAHEFTHGVNAYEANLAYRRESGALSESYSDVFGELVENWARGCDWQSAEDIYTPSTPGDAGRSLSNPPLYGQPDHMDNFRSYPSTTTCDSSNDNCGVHYNSGIPNKAAYLLSEGGTHHGITVQGIGRAKTELLYYRTLTTYLTSSSNFSAARTYTLKACQDLYGKNGPEYRAVQDAFGAVGIGDEAKFYTRLYIDGSTINTWYTTALGAGESNYGWIDVKVGRGSHTVKVYVDYSNLVVEDNESNNTRTETWTWY